MSWLDPFCIAVLLRQHDKLKQIQQFPLDFYLDVAALKNDRFDIALYQLLMGIAAQITDNTKPDLPLLLQDLADASAPETFKGNQERMAFAYDILMAMPQLVSHIYTRNGQPGFSKALDECLAQYHRFYSEDEDYKMDKSAFRSLGLMAMGALAHDMRDYEVDCSSEYMEAWLVEGKFSE